MKTIRMFLASFVVLVLTACSLVPGSESNPFIGYWSQVRLSDHPLGMGLCGNYQNIEFLDNGTFILTNDFSGVYDLFNFGDTNKRSLDGVYEILNKNQVKLVFNIDDQSETWDYVFTSDELIMSFPAPKDLGGGYIPCYFTKADK